MFLRTREKPATRSVTRVNLIKQYTDIIGHIPVKKKYCFLLNIFIFLKTILVSVENNGGDDKNVMARFYIHYLHVHTKILYINCFPLINK